ncbi:MAG: hypothetical protein OEY85_04745 [Rhodospirillales bacterium]|nr:hypothetical protein [Rhodospirillales bacterium]
MSGEIVFEKEMGIDHADFFRLLPHALDRLEYIFEDSRAVISDGAKRLEITLSETGERRIALMSVPVTHVRFAYFGYSREEAEEFQAHIDRRYQRGGG